MNVYIKHSKLIWSVQLGLFDFSQKSTKKCKLCLMAKNSKKMLEIVFFELYFFTFSTVGGTVVAVRALMIPVKSVV
jgi:hypothetical protein